MCRYVFYYGIKKLDNSYAHEVAAKFSDNPKTLEKWLKTFQDFTKLIKETCKEPNNE